MTQNVVALDIETTTAHDRIWCCSVAFSVEEAITFTEGSKELQRAIENADIIVGHNIVFFDAPLLEKLWGISIPSEKIRDTLVLSRLYNPEAKPHSLEAWGQKLAFSKGDFSDYDSGYSEEMRLYCEQDTKLTWKLYHHLREAVASGGFSEASQELEHDVARVIAGQERNGFRFNLRASEGLYERLCQRMNEITEELQRKFPPIVTERYSEKTGKRLKDDVEEFNIGSRQQIAKRLESLGANFSRKTENGNVSVDETVLAEIALPEAQLCAEYLLIQKRVGLIEGWMKAYNKETGRIHGKVLTNGAVTGRMTHHSPNLAQVPATRAPYGEECRSLFTVEEGNVLVGADASGLELRMLAHYMQDKSFIDEVVEGDVHTRNMEAAGLNDRDTAKTFIYAFLYGAGSSKIGSIVGGSKNDGAKLKAKFLENTPDLKKLINKVSRIAQQGSVPGLDGRRLRIRSGHAALNTLLQGAGAIVMKKALVLLVARLDARVIPYKMVANVHDEFQIETPEHYGEAVGINAVKAIREAGEALELRCPLDGEYKIGLNWASTH